MTTRLRDLGYRTLEASGLSDAIAVATADEGPIDIAHLKGKQLKTFRRRVQMIFQDPYESMNPRRTAPPWADAGCHPRARRNSSPALSRRARRQRSH